MSRRRWPVGTQQVLQEIVDKVHIAGQHVVGSAEKEGVIELVTCVFIALGRHIQFLPAKQG